MMQVRHHITQELAKLEDVEIVSDNFLLGSRIYDENADYQLDISALFTQPKTDEDSQLIIISFVYFSFLSQRTLIEAINFIVSDTEADSITHRDIKKGLSKSSGRILYHSALISKSDRLEHTCNTIIDLFDTYTLEPYRKEPWRGIAAGIGVSE